jgi:hypothetical protein
MTLNHLLIVLRLHWFRQGWPLQAGTVLLLAAAASYLALLRPLQGNVVQLQAQNLTRSQALLQSATGQPDRGNDQAHFLASLPADDQVLSAVYAIHTLAQKAGVTLDKGEYRSLQEPGSNLRRHELVFPAKGPYPPLQSWLRTLAQEQPTLALSSLSVQRDNVLSEAIEARVTLVLYAKAP